MTLISEHTMICYFFGLTVSSVSTSVSHLLSSVTLVNGPCRGGEKQKNSHVVMTIDSRQSKLSLGAGDCTLGSPKLPSIDEAYKGTTSSSNSAA